MKAYDKTAMLQLIEQDEDLHRKCEVIAESDDDPIAKCFLTYVVMDPERVKAYEKLLEPKETPLYYMPDTPVIAAIRELVNKFGWREFLKGLSLFAAKKADQMKRNKMFDASTVWQAVYDKFQTVRKNVQL